MFTQYDQLSSVEKTYYQTMLRIASTGSAYFEFAHAANTDSIGRAYDAMLTDNPQFFWLSGGGQFVTTTQGNRVIKVTFQGGLAEGIRAADVPRITAELERAVSAIVAKARTKRTVYEQVHFVHDHLVDTTDYVMQEPMRYSAYGCLVRHRAVCAGYAKAFMMIMRRLGYVCGYASGYGVNSNVSHAWNFIQLDGEFYFIDVTWDDPITAGNTAHGGNKTQEYFCLSSEELSRTHRLSGKYPVPRCTGKRYNYYTYNGYVLPRYSFAEVSRLAEKQLRTSDRFTVKFTSPAETDRARQDLILAKKVFQIPGVSRQIRHAVSDSGLILTVYNNT